ncbi:UDP-2,3-diacylglucosamine diphosphatase [Aquimarina spongiae]|uniref:UDP-2,3-diacylglucosamine pyrophosphatase LpxH n=1 Tax=Aquimarina spongiae TaxID=570521 RepID=A0A1M6AST8_9FLAO|nr:UDP-2,3-diacylglucosamine diphosphatase [Aquimarina spongiae]SHI39530.1 UDP-2,3-diacylglucosamine pyrophosphatase LpxH [Aquimarina spongiae]
MKKRAVDLVVISDVHLGTYGCHAKELLHYLNSIKPKKLILNGDIIDIWQFRKRYFPKPHLKVIKKIISFASKGTEVIYITGNHDEMLRKFSDTEMGSFKLVDKLVLELDGKQAWFFHGDIFDASIQNAKWLAKLGGWGYDMLILLNQSINWFLVKFGKEKFSLSKKIKNSVKKAVKYISDFEDVAAELAVKNNYEFVVCGHIHQPQMRTYTDKNGSCMYLNSGDWIENLTSLEYHDQEWKLVHYQQELMESYEEPQEEIENIGLDLEELQPSFLMNSILNKKI